MQDSDELRRHKLMLFVSALEHTAGGESATFESGVTIVSTDLDRFDAQALACYRGEFDPTRDPNLVEFWQDNDLAGAREGMAIARECTDEDTFLDLVWQHGS